MSTLLSNSLAVVLFLLIAGFCVQNAEVYAPLTLMQEHLPAGSVPASVGIGAIVSAIATALGLRSRFKTVSQKSKRSARELERQEVSTEAAQAKIQTLEGQVKTLEEALSRALKSSYPQS